MRKLRNVKEKDLSIVTMPSMVVINYGIQGDPHSYFINPRDKDGTLWELICKKQLFNVYDFFENHALKYNDDQEQFVPLETPINDLYYELVNITDESSGKKYEAWCAELFAVETIPNHESSE